MKTGRIAAFVLSFALAATITGVGSANDGNFLSLTGQEVSAEVMTVRTASKAKQSDAEKYMEQLRNGFHEYAECSQSVIDGLKTGDYSKTRKALDDSDKALKKLEGIKAPKKYASRQKKIVKAAAKERGYSDICREFIDLSEKYEKLEKIKNPTKKDMKEAEKLVEEIEKVNKKLESFDSGFSEIFLDTVKSVKADINAQK